MNHRLRRAGHVLALTTTATGALGLIISRHLALTATPGAFLVDVPGDYIWGRQLAFNPLAALLTVGAGLLALAAVHSARRPATLTAAGAATALALATTADLTRTHPTLGARAGNVALLLALGVGLTALELSSPGGHQPPT